MSITFHALLPAALAGLTGAPHCLIMCGGISSSYAMQASGSRLPPVLAYNAGRIATYTVTGGFMGAAGSFINYAASFAGIQGIASMAGGCLMLLWAWRRYTLPTHHGSLLDNRFISEKIKGLRSRFEMLSIFLTGICLGFLPCGLTYAMQMNAAASGSWLEGMALMLAFGLSTLPVLLVAAFFAGGIRRSWRSKLRQAGYSLAIVMGVLAVLKGMSSNGWIPSVHPWLW